MAVQCANHYTNRATYIQLIYTAYQCILPPAPQIRPRLRLVFCDIVRVIINVCKLMYVYVYCLILCYDVSHCQ